MRICTFFEAEAGDSVFRDWGLKKIKALENAGAIWVDAPVVVDKQFISSRNSDDLLQFRSSILNWKA